MDANSYLQQLGRQMFNKPTVLPQLIGLSGKAGAGKDTLALHLVRNFDYQQYAFAWPIKRAIDAILGTPAIMWEDRDWKERSLEFIDASPRKLAQTLGTEWGRDLIDKDIWLKLMEQRFNVAHHMQQGMVVSDVRFENEASKIRELGGVVVIINRKAAGPVANHSSEKGLRKNKRDIILENDGSISDLTALADDRLTRWASGTRGK